MRRRSSVYDRGYTGFLYTLLSTTSTQTQCYVGVYILVAPAQLLPPDNSNHSGLMQITRQAHRRAASGLPCTERHRPRLLSHGRTKPYKRASNWIGTEQIEEHCICSHASLRSLKFARTKQSQPDMAADQVLSGLLERYTHLLPSRGSCCVGRLPDRPAAQICL